MDGSLPALLIVANVVSVANSNFQLATLVLIIGNILTLATFSKTRLKIPNENMEEGVGKKCEVERVG